MNGLTDKKLTKELNEFANKKGVLSTKRLFDFLGRDPNERLCNSVPKPSAHTNTSCTVGTSPSELLLIINSALQSARLNNKTLATLIEIQMLNGLRITEALRIRYSQINPIGQVLIKGLKGSNDRIINTGSSSQFFINCRRTKSDPYPYFSRFYVYREYKKLGLYFRFDGREKQSVTHLFRHFVIKMNKSNDVDLSTLQSFIGHKSIKSTRVYGK